MESKLLVILGLALLAGSLYYNSSTENDDEYY